MPFPVRFIRSARCLLLTATTVAVLAACGGGGGDTAPAPNIALVQPAVLSNEQAQQIAGRVISSLAFGISGTVFSAALYDIAISTPTPTGSEVCSAGGTIGYARTDVAPINVVSAGDSISLTGNNCTDASTGVGVTFNGTVNEVVNSILGTPYTGAGTWALAGTQNYTNLLSATGGQSVTVNGTLAVNDRYDGNAYTFTNYSVSNAATQRATTITSGIVSLEGAPLPSVNLRFANLVMQTSLSPTEKVNVSATQTVAQQIFINGSQQVSAGVLPIVLEKVRITVYVTGPNTVRLELDNNADGSIDSTQNVTWTGLVAAGAL
jgi:hypothetical protein